MNAQELCNYISQEITNNYEGDYMDYTFVVAMEYIQSLTVEEVENQINLLGDKLSMWNMIAYLDETQYPNNFYDQHEDNENAQQLLMYIETIVCEGIPEVAELHREY